MARLLGGCSEGTSEFFIFIYLFIIFFFYLSNPTHYNSQGGEHTGKKIHNYSKVIT